MNPVSVNTVQSSVIIHCVQYNFVKPVVLGDVKIKLMTGYVIEMWIGFW